MKDKRHIIKTIVIVLTLLFSQSLLGQNFSLSGRVFDEKGESLVGATVNLKGYRLATVTDLDGRFSLSIPQRYAKEKLIIRVRYMGMKTKLVAWKGKALKIYMQANNKQLKEFVVLGRSVNDIDIRAKSGVVSKIDMKEVLQKPMIDLSLALQGTAPGLVVINRGELGVKPKIRIRGNNSFRKGDAANEPLYVLDSKIISPEAFITLNPIDIKEIKVLKDAAASALYGVKAANGVIEITSRRGVKGPLRLAISSNYGITLKGRRTAEMMKTKEKLEIERLMKSTNAPGYVLSADFYQEAQLRDVQNIYFQQYGIKPTADRSIYKAFASTHLDSLRQIDTDWFEELLRTNIYQSHNISLRGGNDDIAYYVSANYSKQGGQIEGNDTQRISLNNSLDWQIPMGLISLGTNVGYALTNTPNGSHYSPQTLVYKLNPYETKASKKLYSHPNKAYADLMNQFRRQSSELRIGSSLSLSMRPFDGLSLDAVFGMDFVYHEMQEITPASSYSEQTQGKKPVMRGKIAAARNTDFNYSSNVRATYHKVFNEKHDLTFSTNTDYYYARVKLLSVEGHGIGLLESLAGVNKSKGSAYTPDFVGSNMKMAQFGFGLSLGYTYDNTYDLFAAYKADASSLLPPSKRWNKVWALGGGIHLTPLIAKFVPSFKDNKVLTDLNLKTSFGSTASLGGISSSLALPIFSYNQSAYYGDYFRLLTLGQMYNKDLRPETVNNFDLGLELQLFKRYNMGVQLYRKDTHNALLDVRIPSSNGFRSMLRNVGQLRNEGIELMLSGRIIDNDVCRLSARTTLAYNQNLVVDLYEASALYSDDESLFPDYEEGKAYDELYALNSIGINPLFGYPVFLDKQGNEKPFYSELKREDFISVGYSNPPYQGTFSLNFALGQFDFDTQFYYVLGGKKPYSFRYVRDKDNIHKNAIAGQLERTWFKAGDKGKLYPSPHSTASTYQNLSIYANTRMLASSNYLRLSMLSLRYRLKEKTLKTLGGLCTYAALSLQVSNLFTLSPYKGSSPESGTYDIGVQPVYSFNLNLNF